jgi:PAS domain S-box-containing protein
MFAERSDRLIYLRVLAPLVLATVTLVAVSIGGFHVLSGARAYVGAENLWSNARSQAVAKLRAHASLGPLADPCPPMTDWLAIPMGDHAARLALDRPTPEVAAARSGFERGGNLPGDSSAMIDLYRYFGSTPLLAEPIKMWRKGDALIEQLSAVGSRICAPSPIAPDAVRQLADLRELDRLDDELIAVETGFSSSLGKASLQTEELLRVAILLLALTLVGSSVWYVTRSLRAQLRQRQALIDANTRWELAAQAAGVGLFAWHPEDDSTDLDHRARQIYGVNAPSDLPLVRSEVRGLIHPDDLATLRQVTPVSLTKKGPLRSRFRVLREDGSIRHVEAIGMFRNGGPNAGGRYLVGVIRDVTEEVAASTMHAQKVAAERSAQARTEFLSRLSHELRTPLNAVLGVAQILDIDTQEPLTPQQRRRVQLILDSGWHLLRLVDDVLDITSIDAGQVSLRMSPVELGPVLRASLHLVEAERTRSNVRVVDRWPTHTAAVLADPQRLQQVLVNVLSNACKYNTHGGELRLGYREEGDMLCLSFQDEGPGIEQDQLAELFQPFRRLARTAEVQGTGLGLVVVKLLTEQMQGRVEVTSELGRGSTFSIWLRKAD